MTKSRNSAPAPAPTQPHPEPGHPEHAHAHAHPHPHGHDHPVHEETVIHDYSRGQTILMRWFNHAKETAWFWLAVAAIVLVPVGAVIFNYGWLSGAKPGDLAWRDLSLATNAEQWEAISKDYPDTPAALWARMHLAEAKLNEGIAALTRNRSEADPALEEAQSQYEAVVEAAPADSLMKRLATFGLARSYEVRNDLAAAVKLYKSVSQTWPDSFEGKRSQSLVALLDNAQGQQFYKSLYDYKPVSLAPGQIPGQTPGNIPAGDIPPVFTPEGGDPAAVDPYFPAIVPDNPFAAPVNEADRALVPAGPKPAPASTPAPAAQPAGS